MKYTIVENHSRPRKDRSGRRKDRKPVHELGKCKCIDDARDLAEIWFNLMLTSGHIGKDIGHFSGRGFFPRYDIQDEEGRIYSFQKREDYSFCCMPPPY